MPMGTISSSKDCVGVAVVNYKVPVCETKQDVLENCEKIAQMIWGSKRGYPGLDLIIFPEYSTQGLHPTKWMDLTTTVDGPEVEVLYRACAENQAWGICSRTGENTTLGTQWHSIIILNKRGAIV